MRMWSDNLLTISDDLIRLESTRTFKNGTDSEEGRPQDSKLKSPEMHSEA